MAKRRRGRPELGPNEDIEELLGSFVGELVNFSLEGCVGRDYKIACRIVRAMFGPRLRVYVARLHGYNVGVRISDQRTHGRAPGFLREVFPEYAPSQEEDQTSNDAYSG